jgi:hypothetical protein
MQNYWTSDNTEAEHEVADSGVKLSEHMAVR